MLKNQKGFTLVELIVVIVIIGILAAIAVPKFQDLSNSAKAAACKQNQAAIESAAAIYYAHQAIAGTAQYPASIQVMIDENYIDANAATCPGGGTYNFDSTTGLVTCSEATHQRR